MVEREIEVWVTYVNRESFTLRFIFISVLQNWIANIYGPNISDFLKVGIVMHFWATSLLWNSSAYSSSIHLMAIEGHQNSGRNLYLWGSHVQNKTVKKLDSHIYVLFLIWSMNFSGKSKLLLINPFSIAWFITELHFQS